MRKLVEQEEIHKNVSNNKNDIINTTTIKIIHVRTRTSDPILNLTLILTQINKLIPVRNAIDKLKINAIDSQILKHNSRY
jgi:hypothetical protein